uniref:Neuronal PAS domain protein 4 like n=1 Tax=Echeneis naucrates TaxID=173247 RepID=A0A665WNP7_ECHNA
TSSAAMVSHRSTKGASKARRDHINYEIRNMRSLLPISLEDQERLSYLHSMAAICTYIRKSVLLQGKCPLCIHVAFLQALHGFILVTTAQGRLVYVSENVSEYLGLSMIDVLQGDTVYEMVERSDVGTVKSNLDVEYNSSSERSFVCCMQTSKAFKLRHGSICSMLVRGSFRSFPPRSGPPPLLCSLAGPGAAVRGALAVYYLGYSAEELIGRSWYSLVHPEDLSSSADSHRSLMQTDEVFRVQMVLRLQRQDLTWTWIYTEANRDSACQSQISAGENQHRCLQAIISGKYLPFSSSTGSPLSNSQHSSRGDSSPPPLGDSSALFTPPYSPPSPTSALQQEELGRDLLIDVHGYTDQLLSSPEGSPSYYAYPEGGLTCHHSPTAAERGAFGVLTASSPLSSSSPSYDFQACASDARLVPDCLSVSDMCGSPSDCAHHVPQHVLPIHPSLLTPDQSPTSSEPPRYDEREQAEISILAQQISSLASSFDMYHTLNPSACDWPPDPPLLPPKRELVLDDGVFDSILKDLDMVGGKSKHTDLTLLT